MKTIFGRIPTIQLICLVLFFLLGIPLVNAQKSLSVFFPDDSPQVRFGVQELKKELVKSKVQVQTAGKQSADICFVIASGSGDLNKAGFQLKPEGFNIQKNNAGKITVMGADEAGLMYGGLELAEQIRLSGLKGAQNTEQNPYMEVRGSKFNIPLDVRTPSYTDCSEVSQFNIPEVWNFSFWQAYIDNLARNRFNLISLWSLHPFPSIAIHDSLVVELRTFNGTMKNRIAVKVDLQSGQSKRAVDLTQFGEIVKRDVYLTGRIGSHTISQLLYP